MTDQERAAHRGENAEEECGFCDGGRMLRCPPNEPSFTIKCPYCEGRGKVANPEYGPVAPYGVLARAVASGRPTCSTCGATNPEANGFCSNGFHAPALSDGEDQT